MPASISDIIDNTTKNIHESIDGHNNNIINHLF